MSILLDVVCVPKGTGDPEDEVLPDEELEDEDGFGPPLVPLLLGLPELLAVGPTPESTSMIVARPPHAAATTQPTPTRIRMPLIARPPRE
jgi:hypothetical protein